MVQFSGTVLFTRGNGFPGLDNSQELKDKDIIQKIEGIQTDFKEEVNQTKNRRRSRNNKPFICKAAFIKRWSLSDSIICKLLADEGLLFSAQYQIYQTNHPHYLELKKRLSNASDCIELSLRGIADEKKDEFRSALCVIEKSRTHSCSLENMRDELCRYVQKEQSEHTDISDRSCLPDKISVIDNISNLPPEVSALFETQIGFLSISLLEVSETPAKLAFKKLKEWYPNINISESNQAEFISKALFNYLYGKKEQALVKKEMKHFREKHLMRDEYLLNEYEQRLAQLSCYVQKHKTWTLEDGIIKRIKKTYVVPSSSKVNAENETYKKAQIYQLTTITEAYLNSVKSKESKQRTLSPEDVQDVATAIGLDTIEFPFIYLATCIKKKMNAFLKTNRERCDKNGTILISKGEFNDFLINPYTANPNKKAQRYSAIVFLDALNTIFADTDEKKSQNWKLFLRVFGTEILSEEEQRKWSEITRRTSIPPIQLSEYCSTLLKTCIPVSPEHLYCYTSGSSLHQGRFAEFCASDKVAISACCSKIKKNPAAWQRDRIAYLKEWCSITCNKARVKEICSTSFQRIERRSLGRHYTSFKRSLPKQSEKDELNSLIMELAIRHSFADEAIDILRHKAEKCFSKGSDFAIHIQKGGNTPE